MDGLPLVGEIANIPEYHDCQRFIMPVADQNAAMPKERYGPLVAVWAAHGLDSLLMVPVQQRGSGIPAAVIHNFDRQEYRPLQIRPGFSCVYLMPDPASRGNWKAKIEPLGPSPKNCELPKSWTLIGGPELVVNPARPVQGLVADDIPPVARWGWDQASTKQYLGIRCGDQWCDISDGSFTPSNSAMAVAAIAANVARNVDDMPPAAAITQASRSEILRVLSVKGWYDEQTLALRDPGTNQLVPSGITGIAFPHPVLDRMSKRSVLTTPTPVLTGTWIPSAYIIMSADYPGKVPLYQGLNRIFLCEGTAADCGIPPDGPTCGGTLGSSWARIVPEPGKGGPYYHCVRQMNHHPDIPAGAVRWRWSELDEKQWVRCPTTGCCTVN